MPKNETATFTVASWPVTKIKPYEKNARVIPEKAVDLLVKSITEFGWQQPIVVDKKGVIIAGHTRFKAALKMGLANVPVKVADGLSPEKVRALRIMDNRSNEETKWDKDVLKEEIVDLQALGIDMTDLSDMTGFDPAQLDKLIAEAPTSTATGDEDPPEKEKKAKADAAKGRTRMLHECPKCGHQWHSGEAEATTKVKSLFGEPEE